MYTRFISTMSLAAATAALIGLSTQARADDPPQGTLVGVSVRELFVPNGFDDNDEVEVVLDGELPNTCYKLAHNEVKYDEATGRYIVFQFARRYPGICIQTTVPFFTAARLGVVPAGDFKVQTLGAALETLKVKEATSAGPDDYTYAPIDSARVERDEAHNKYFGIIQGRMTNTCMTIDEVKVFDSGKTIEVLPIIKMVDRPDCAAIEMPFAWQVDLPASMAEGRHLMHVRSLNGKSQNMVFSVYPDGTVTHH